MKKLLSRGLGIALVSLLLVTTSKQKSFAQDVSVSYQTFYDNLSPYGQWVEDPQYGNVWVPNEGGDFRPYGSRGHWVMTDYGNTWVSDDPWGWACYHYGRWTYDSYYGWVWVPGYEWAPAWVTWRYGGGYSGWAPLGPGISIGVSYNCPESWWIFVQPQYMYSNDCYSHWRGPGYNNTYIRQTTIINNYYVDNRTRVRYNYGPGRDVVQRDIHQPVQVYRVSQMNRPGSPVVQNNRVSMYRPSMNRATASTARPANVMQAPRQIGRPQAATNVSAGRQPEFRQQVQRQQAQPQGGGASPREQQRGNSNQPAGRAQQGQLRNSGVVSPRDQRGNSQPANNFQLREPQNGGVSPRGDQRSNNQPADRFQQRAPQNTGVVSPRDPRGNNNNQAGERTQQSQFQSRPEPTRQQPQSRPEPMRQQPQSRPEPMRQQPQSRPEPMRQQPQSRPEPMRQQPQMQQPQSRPQPQGSPMQQGREGGRR